jgi:aspartyl-tRNA(Asn)/glutamyl-tRNA(Gln) amidotransferase subunit A
MRTLELPEVLTFEVATLSSKLRAREISSVEATEAYLGWISERDGKLGSYITVTQERALADAARADREIAAGNWRGPFHGVPLGLKDNVYTKGVLTTAGSKILENFRPDFDATAWTKLASQGAVLLGKLNLNEFAYGGLLKRCRNPYDPERFPGGSSAGPAAAVAARMCAAAIGTDTSGSIRIPAAQCGCVGLKPTYGRVSRFGVIPLAYTMDHVGPITRSVRDAALMMNVIAGFDQNDSTSSRELAPDFTATLAGGVRGLRVGIIRQLTEGLSPEVSSAFGGALRLLASSGAHVDEVSIPTLEFGALINATVTWVEALDYHERWLRERRNDYGKEIRLNLETGMLIPALEYFRAQRGRARLLAEALSTLHSHDVLVSPGVATTALKFRDYLKMDGQTRAELGYRNQLRFTQPFDATGQPAIAIPTGIADDGLPTSMQIVGRPFDEATVLRVAAGYEAARGPLSPPPI